MSNSERSPEKVTENIHLEQGSNAVVLVTTRTQREVFLDVEDVVTKKSAESKGYIKPIALQALGITAIIVGASITTDSDSYSSSNIGIAKFLSGVAVTIAGAGAFYLSKGMDDKAALASRQFKKVRSAINELRLKSK